MGKEIRHIYKYSQSQLSTPSFKALLCLSSAFQTSSFIESTSTSVPSVIEKNQNNSVLFSQKTTQNDERITNNDNVQSCDTGRKNL